MSTKYKTIITHAGAEKFAAATLPGGKKVNITAMAIGDGGGSLPEPNAAQTQLINEVWRHALNKISQDNKKKNYIVAELVIPPEVGGFWSREMGLYDDTGTMVAVANMAESYKPELAEGSGRAQTVRMVIMVCDITSVELSIDGSVVMATKDYVDDAIAEHEKSRRHPDASLTEKGFTRLNSAADSVDETTAATPKAVKIAMDNASVRLAKERNLADLPNPALARQSLQLGDSATKNTGTTANTVAAGDDTRIVGAMQRGQNGADIPDKDLFVRTAGAARAYSAAIHIGGDNNPWTTAEFIVWLEGQGAFNHPYWMCKGSWTYANNKLITDTGCGDIHLAGAVVEVMGTRGAMTIRITTSSTATSGGITNAQFTYINNGDAYAPGWRRDYNTANKPSASDVGAVSANGGNYNHTFKFGRVETIPTEKNMSALFNQTGDAGTIVSGAEYNWYNDKITTGITRGSSDSAWGYAIRLNGNDLLTLDTTGYARFTGDVVSSGGIMGLQGDDRRHFVINNADGSTRLYIYKDKGGDGIRFTNGVDGGGTFIMGNGGQFTSPATIHAGAATLETNGDVYGSVWGTNWLSIWLNNQFAARDANINNRATWDYVNGRTHGWTDGESGWWKDENSGFIYQWTVGPWVKDDENVYSVNFPMRFPNQCCTVNVGTHGQSEGNRSDANAVVYGWNQDICRVQMNIPGESSWWQPMRAIIFAIGR
jgi:hypothetical protein